MKISVCIPMYNEERIIRKNAKVLFNEMEDYCAANRYEYEIIFSDDGSSDRSLKEIEELRVEIKPTCGDIIIVGSEVNRGKGAAVRRGVAASSGDVILYTDCDLAYGTKIIAEICDQLIESDNDIIIGSRALHPMGYEGYTFLRKAASKTYLKILSLFAGFDLSDSQCGLKAFKSKVAKDLFSNSTLERWSFDFEILMMAAKRGYKISEIPVKVVNHRESKIHMIKDSFTMLADIYRIRKNM